MKNNIYLDPLKIVLKYKLTLILAALFYCLYYLRYYNVSKSSPFLGLLLDFVLVVLIIGNQIYTSLAVFVERGFLSPDKLTLGVIKTLFWRSMSQKIIGGIASLSLFAVFVAILYVTSFANYYIMFVTVFMMLLLISYWGFGFISIGFCIMLAKNKGAFASTLLGFKELRKLLTFYFPVFIIVMALSLLPIALVIFLGSKLSSIQIVSWPLPTFPVLFQNYTRIMNAGLRYNFIYLVNILFTPWQTAIITFAYLSQHPEFNKRKPELISI